LETFLFYSLNGLVLGILYALSALGVALTVGVMRVINFAHGEFYVLGAYLSAFAAWNLGFSFFPSLAVGIAGVCLSALLIERFFLRQTYGDTMKSLILTFILGILIQNALLAIFGPYPQKPPQLLSGSLSVFGFFDYGSHRLIACTIGVFLILSFYAFLRWSWFGRSLRAVSGDPKMAQIVGVNTRLANQAGFVLSAAMTSAAGILLSPSFPVSPTSGASISLTSFIVVVLGGMGSFGGCIFAGLVLGMTESLGAAYISNVYRPLFGLAALAVVLAFRPGGFAGRKIQLQVAE
jgi:branched-chain amino acid transport system permease protein